MKNVLFSMAALMITISTFATEGALSGKFTINANGDKIVFSKGNLQYKASTHTWRFAENQYDLIGADNANISDTYDGYIDLFGWGTGNNPTFTSEDREDYKTFNEWGANAISNGGNQADLWRTLSTNEWLYLFHNRTNAEEHFAWATVNNVRGIIILPDEWTTPDGLTLASAADSSVIWRESYPYYYYFEDSRTHFADNVYTSAEWQQMETAGAVFLPAGAGQRSGTEYYSDNGEGLYWSSTGGGDCPMHLRFAYYSLRPQATSMWNYSGFSVRLVQTYKEPVEYEVAYVCDFTKQASSTNQNYNATWTYDNDWKIFGGSTYCAGWNYCKFGGKSNILAEANPVYLANIEPFHKDVKRIKVYIHAGSLGNSKMSVNSWGVDAYSSDDYAEANRLGTVAGTTISRTADTIIIDIDDANSAWWAAGNYLRVYWDLANESTTSGIIWVDKVEFCTVKGAPEIMREVEVTAVFPRVGQPIVTPLAPTDSLFNMIGQASVPDGANYSIKEYGFGIPCCNPLTETFLPNETYLMIFTIGANEGYSFPMDADGRVIRERMTSVKVNGNEVLFDCLYDGTIYFTVRFTPFAPDTIREVDITAVFPKEGQPVVTPLSPTDPQFNVIGQVSVPGDANYTIEQYGFANKNGHDITESTFQPNTTYIMWCKVFPKEDYTFPIDASGWVSLMVEDVRINGIGADHNSGHDYVMPYIPFTISNTTAISDVQNDHAQCAKVIRDGQLFIRRGDELYNAQGARVK